MLYASAWPAAAALVGAAVLQTATMLVLTGIRVYVRFRARVVVNAEDLVFNPGSAVGTAEPLVAQRAQRALQAELESGLGFVLLATLFVLGGASAAAGTALFGLYLGARVGCAAFAVAGRPIWERRCAALSQLCVLGLAGALLVMAWGA